MRLVLRLADTFPLSDRTHQTTSLPGKTAVTGAAGPKHWKNMGYHGLDIPNGSKDADSIIDRTLPGLPPDNTQHHWLAVPPILRDASLPNEGRYRLNTLASVRLCRSSKKSAANRLPSSLDLSRSAVYRLHRPQSARHR